jgi:transcriptional regulator with PAS, ATPase and Fis domain
MDIVNQLETLTNRMEAMENELKHLRTELIYYQLRAKTTKPVEVPIISSDITTGKVKLVNYVKEYEYKNKKFEQFLLTLDNDAKYYVDKLKGSSVKIEENDEISFRVDGNKLREVRVLYHM